ncbi:hypothetical protein [Streptomyces katrae]|uniref:hypothetical protein n=1 Tax=Streptomyces katrae TaxID=68223 RepID=UPI0012FF173E|nr:hypothetical protein [Streptomyces katrae]
MPQMVWPKARMAACHSPLSFGSVIPAMAALNSSEAFAPPGFEELGRHLLVGVRERIRTPSGPGGLVVLVQHVDQGEPPVCVGELGFLHLVGRMVHVHRLDVETAVRRRGGRRPHQAAPQPRSTALWAEA